MRSSVLGCVAMLVAFGCGDDEPPGDGPAGSGGPVTFLHQNLQVTDFAFPLTVVDGRASALFVIRNDTDATLASIATTLAGDPGFVIDEAMSTCVAGPELVPHDLCTIMVRLTTDANDASTQLVVTSGEVVSRLPIRVAVGVSGGVVSDTSAIDFGIVPLGSSGRAELRLTNLSASPVALQPSVEGPFAFGGSDCPFSSLAVQTVPAGGSCNVTVGFTASIAGWVEATPKLAGAPVTLAAYGARRTFVLKRGTGTGRIASVPTGIDCGADCGSQAAYLIGDVTLSEQADDGSLFAGWQLVCGTAPTCVVPERAEGSVAATFSGAGSAAVTITITGSARGKAFIGSSPPPTGAFDQLTECDHSCTTYVPVGAQLEIYAATASRFDGWTGNCSGGDGHCVFQMVTGDVAATAAFNKEDRELATLLPDLPPPEQAAFAPDGDLVIASGTVVTKLGVDGTVRWSTSIPLSVFSTAPVGDMVVTSDGDIYAYSVDTFTHNAALSRWSMTGAFVSTTSVRRPTCSVGTFTVELAPILMAAPNGDLGVFTGGVVDGQESNQLSVVKSDGSSRFNADLGPGCATAVAVGPDGVYQVLLGDPPDSVATSFHVVRYDASGNLLPGSGPYAMTGSSPSVAIDNTGALAFHFLTYTDGIPASHTIGRIGSNGTLVFSTTGASLSGTRPTVAYDPAGNVIAMSGLVDANGEGGLRLEQLSPAGAPLWALDKLPHEPSQNLPVFRIRDVVVDGTGSLAVVGSYSPVTDAPGAWIAIYQP